MKSATVELYYIVGLREWPSITGLTAIHSNHYLAEDGMSRDFQIIQLDIEPDAFKKLPNRLRNQFVGCMHAHNELAVLNRLLMFSLNDVGDGELHNDAHGVQMWCVLQVLIGKLFETWNMLGERFLKSNPEDAAVAQL